MHVPEDRSLHFCLVDGRAIFLDPHRGRYFALPSRRNCAFAAAVGGIAMGTVPGSAFHALGTDPKNPGPNFSIAVLPPAHPHAAATADREIIHDRTQVPALLVLQVTLAALAARLLVRICPLRWLLAGIASGRRRSRPTPDSDSIDRLAAAFRRSNLLIRKDGNCLPLTLAFVWLSRRRGHDPRLVIGVRVNPFAAHCWSQDGATVLNDSYDHIRTYQPILIL
jgi:hypothetical protein